MRKKFIQVGYMLSLTSKSMKLLTADIFQTLVHSAEVNAKMARIEAETDAEKKSEIKRELPVVLYQCAMPEDGVRPTAATAQPSGFCMHDWDHMPMAPREFYFQNIAGREEELRIVLAHVTPRGEGLRLVTLLKTGESIAQCQQRLAEQFGMEEYRDAKICDLSRTSFLPGSDYILYINNEEFFEQPAPDMMAMPDAKTEAPAQEAVAIVAAKMPETPAKMPEAEANEAKAEAQVKEEAPKWGVVGNKIAESFSYQGIKYNAIIAALLKRIATQGTPCEGERNEDLYILVRELRHICEYNFNTLYMLVAPYFSTLGDAEIRRTINSAVSSNGRAITPVMRGVIDELKNEDVEPAETAEMQELPKLPKLSDVEEMILSHYPKRLRAQVYMAMLPILGTYGTNIRFKYLDGRVNSLSFMTAVMGKSGSGKAFAQHLFTQLTERLRTADTIEREKANQYLAQCNKVSESAEKPDDPQPRVRIYGDDITTSQLLDYLYNLKGQHGLQFTEEVARMVKARRTIYGDNDDLYCKAFDNGIGGKESKSKLTKNIRIPIFLNFLLTGTPGAMHKFFNNPEGGLNNRIIYAFMPNERSKDIPHYEDFTDEERKVYEETLDRLEEVGKDGQMVQLPWLEKTIRAIKRQWDKEDDENPDDVWYDLGKRAMVVAMRAGVLEWFMRNCPTDEKELREISKLVKWMAHAMRQNIYLFCGQDYEEICEQENAIEQKQSRMSKNKKLFSLLPQEFSIQDLIALRAQNGESMNVKMIISRWFADGKICKISGGRFKKLNELVA